MGGDGGFEGQAVGGEIGALNTFQVQVGGDFLAFDGAKVRVADVLPGLFAVEDVLLDLLDLVGPLQAEEDGLPLDGAGALAFAGADQTASQDVALGQFADFFRVDVAEIIGANVDDQGAVQDAAGVFIVQRHRRRDEVDVGTGRGARESLS